MRITIAMGGIGQRINCEDKGLSSKAFLQMDGITLLERIMQNIDNVFSKKNKIYLAITNEKQKQQLETQKFLNKYNYEIVYNGNKIFDLIKPETSNLLIYADTYMLENIIIKLYNNYKKTKASQFISIDTETGIDNVIFETDSDYKVISVQQGNQTKEISQIFLFNQNDSKKVYSLNLLNINRFDIVYKHIIVENECYVLNVNQQCFNINTEKDFNNIKNI